MKTSQKGFGAVALVAAVPILSVIGFGATQVLAHTDDGWKLAASLAETPSCTGIDQYKISKEITPTCYDNKTELRPVTYP